MEEDLKEIEDVVSNIEKCDISKIQTLLGTFLKTHIKRSKTDNFIGDYPTFIEPVYLGDKVKIGDDVLIGPNVYIGANSEIGDYGEISNTIILDNVIIGKNFKLDNCIVGKKSSLTFTNLNVNNCVLIGKATSEGELRKIDF